MSRTPDRSVTPSRPPRQPAAHGDVPDAGLLVLLADRGVAGPLVEAAGAHLRVQLDLGRPAQRPPGGAARRGRRRRGRRPRTGGVGGHPADGRRRPPSRSSSRPVATTRPASSRLSTCTAVASAASCSISGGTPCSSTKTRVRSAAISGRSAGPATAAVGPRSPGAPAGRAARRRGRAGSAGRSAACSSDRAAAASRSAGTARPSPRRARRWSGRPTGPW